MAFIKRKPSINRNRVWHWVREKLAVDRSSLAVGQPLTLLPVKPASHPYIAEDEEYKTLHFDSRSIQSCMCKDDPNSLILGYTRAMMGFWLFQAAPRDILIVGLGGGSLSKYCYQEFPDAIITTLEINQAVIALREQFAIPADNDRFRIIHTDAAHYLAGKAAIADVILLDGFEAFGLPPSLSNGLFYNHCYEALRDGGILATNLGDSSAIARDCFAHMQHYFADRTLKLQSKTDDNIIALALKNPRLPMWKNLQARAGQLSEQTRLNFPYMLEQMRQSVYVYKGTVNWLTGLPTEVGEPL